MTQDSLTAARVMGKDLYQSIADLICSDSGSAMAFPSLVIRISSGSNSCFSRYACWDCECWWHYINSFCTYYLTEVYAQIILLILSGISVLMGTGIMLVHVDYKRQLVGSTIAQMGFMLIQCALGAYLAAIIHAVLHGLFKSTLFLQAGSVIHHDKPIKMSN